MSDKKLTFDPLTGELIIVDKAPDTTEQMKTILRFQDNGPRNGEFLLVKEPISAPKQPTDIDCEKYMKDANF